MSYNGVNNYLTTADGATFCTTSGKANGKRAMSKRDKDWKLAYISARDQNESLKGELLLCYQALSTVALDAECESVEREFLAKLCETPLPYKPNEILRDLMKGEFQWWKTKGKPLGE